MSAPLGRDGRSAAPPTGSIPGRIAAVALAGVFAVVILAGVVVRCANLPLYVPDTGDEWGNTIAPFRVLYEADPQTFFHPSLFYDVTAAAYALVFWLLKSVGGIAASMSITDVFFSQPDIFIFTARGVSVAAAVLSLWAVYRLARSLWGWQAGLAAAALLAAFPLHVLYSLQVRVDSLSVSMFVLATASVVGLLERPAPSAYLGAGVLTGLAVGANYPGAILVPWLIVAHLQHRQSCEGHASGPRRLWIALAVAGLTFLCTSPFVVLNAATFAENLSFISGLSTAVHPGWDERGVLYYIDALVQANSLLAALIALSAVAIVLLGNRRERFLLSLAAAYLAVFSLVRSKDERFVLPALVLCLVVGAGLPAIVARPLRWRWVKGAASALAYLLLLAAIWRGAPQAFQVPLPREHESLTRSDGLVLDWIEANVTPRSNVVIESGMVPLIDILKLPGRFAAEMRASVAKLRPRLDQNYIGAVYIGGCNYDPGAVVRGEINYAVISGRNLNFIERNCDSYRVVCDFYAELRARGQLVFETPEGFESALIYDLRSRSQG